MLQRLCSAPDRLQRYLYALAGFWGGEGKKRKGKRKGCRKGGGMGPDRVCAYVWRTPLLEYIELLSQVRVAQRSAAKRSIFVNGPLQYAFIAELQTGAIQTVFFCNSWRKMSIIINPFLAISLRVRYHRRMNVFHCRRSRSIVRSED